MTVAHVLEIEPHFRVSEWVAHTGQRRAQVYIDGLRKQDFQSDRGTPLAKTG